VFMCQGPLQNRLMMRNAITQVANIFEHPMGVPPQERPWRVNKQLSQMWPPEVRFVSPPEETYPESETQLGDQTWRIEGFALVLQGLFCTQYLIPLRVLQAYA